MDDGESSNGRPEATQRKIREEIRAESCRETTIRSSLQPCQTVDGCLTKLQFLEKNTTSKAMREKIHGLSEVLHHMQLPKELGGTDKGYISFKDAYEIFIGHQHSEVDSKNFRDDLLHPTHGLCVNIIQIPVEPFRFIILKSKQLDIPSLLTHVVTEFSSKKNSTGFKPLEIGTIRDILNHLDSEWDKKCVKAILAHKLTSAELRTLGLDVNRLSKISGSVVSTLMTISTTQERAEQCVTERLEDKKNNLEKRKNEKEQLLQTKKDKWPRHVLQDLEVDISTLEDRLKEITAQQNSDCPSAKYKRQQAVKRTCGNLLESDRIKRRNLGAGAPRRLDSDDEDFITKSIEEKATYHGRRQDTVMYMNRRVKSRDLHNIANYRLYLKHQRRIRSATTVWNRSRAKNKRSIQAKRHIGKGLFCTKKPPKAEDKDNILTHHQRAHVDYVRRYLYDSKETDKFALLHSMDDKAYVRPGTSEGLEKTRRMKILTLSSEGAKQLPKYDWPESLVYATPSAHRVMTKEKVTIENESRLIMKDDAHFVYVRPKAIIDSSGTSWASDIVRLHCDHPAAFEIPDPDKDSVLPHFRGYCRLGKYACFQYHDMTVATDIQKMKCQSDCQFREYEHHRVEHLVRLLRKAEKTYTNSSTSTISYSEEIQNGLTQVVLYAEDVQRLIKQSKITPEDILGLAEKCDNFVSLIEEKNLPEIRPRVVHLTDAGPGVGVSNLAVRFRDAELARLERSDYRIRIHRAAGDSGQNEAERTNSASGDAIVDGSTINWEKEKRFEGLSSEERASLSLEEYEEMEKTRMTNNAWYVAREIASRLDGAPVLSEWIHGYVAEKIEHQFFFNKQYLKSYFHSSQQARTNVPGAGYFGKISNFIEQHYEVGELYMEYRKGDCTENGLCGFCEGTPWIGPIMERIPRPMPGKENHYLSVLEAPLTDGSGSRRPVDDFNPRAQLKALFQAGGISLEDIVAIEEFSSKYIVNPSLVGDYLRHMTDMRDTKEIRGKDRQRKRVETSQKTVSDYSWTDLAQNGKLGNLTVHELDKYIDHYKLCKIGRKRDKIRRIIAHCVKDLPTNLETIVAEDSEEESDDDEDEIHNEIGSSSSSEDSEVQDPEPRKSTRPSTRQSKRTRSGRQAQVGKDKDTGSSSEDEDPEPRQSTRQSKRTRSGRQAQVGKDKDTGSSSEDEDPEPRQSTRQSKRTRSGRQAQVGKDKDTGSSSEDEDPEPRQSTGQFQRTRSGRKVQVHKDKDFVYN